MLLQLRLVATSLWRSCRAPRETWTWLVACATMVMLPCKVSFVAKKKSMKIKFRKATIPFKCASRCQAAGSSLAQGSSSSYAAG